MIKKQHYSAPDAELFVVRFERNILSGDNETYTPGGPYTGGFDDDDEG